MKILRLVLENFEVIRNCMGSNYLEIDFRGCQNKICLLLGPNGSGKTAILSQLNPFATIGNLDVRDGITIITPKKHGKKEIWIADGPVVYKIQHYYSPLKDSHSTKSFIQKDDVELNPNGNVTSFKEIVKEELGVEQDYMKLIRLGSNVKSLISLSSTERKTFMGKMLDDIGVYLQYYKHVNNHMRTLKDMLSHTVDKLHKSRYMEVSMYNQEINLVEGEVERLEGQLRDQGDHLAVVHKEIEAIGDIFELREQLEKYGKSLKKMKQVRARLGDDVKDASYYKEEYAKASETLTKKESMLSATELLFQKEFSSRDELEVQIRTLEVQLRQRDETDHEIQRLQKLLKDTDSLIATRKNTLDGFDTSITLSEFESFFSFLKASEQSLQHLYEFGKLPVQKVVQLIRENKDVTKYVNAGILDVRQTDETEILLERIRRIGDFAAPLSCEESTCPARKVWEYVYSLLQDRNVDENDRHGTEFYQEVEMVHRAVKQLLEDVMSQRSYIEKLPEDLQKYFQWNTLLQRIYDEEHLYPVKKMDQFYTMLKEYEDLAVLLSEREKIYENLNRYLRLSKDDAVQNIYDTTLARLNASKAQLSKYQDEMQQYKRDIDELERTAEAMEDAWNTCENYEETKAIVESLQDRYKQYHDLHAKETTIHASMQRLDIILSGKRKELSNLQTEFYNFKDLQKNLKKYQKIYDEMECVKNALSATKGGIPTIITKHYLADTESITNDLLNIAYDGEVQVEPFTITATEFSIPIYIKGYRLPDVKMASQGEVAFLSVALSFALISQSLRKTKRWDIMELDEVDGPLDQNNRRKFIEILENQIDRVGSNQNFLITHNDMFSHYPIDIIELVPDIASKYQLATKIPILLSKPKEEKTV